MADVVSEKFQGQQRADRDLVELIHAFDQLYDGLHRSDAVLTEIEDILDQIYSENQTHDESKESPETLSTEAIETVFIKIRDLENRRSKVVKILQDL